MAKKKTETAEVETKVEEKKVAVSKTKIILAVTILAKIWTIVLRFRVIDLNIYCN